MKTTIRQAYWKSKELWGDEEVNIVTTIYYQGKNAFIDTSSDLLFQMVCENFFRQHPDVSLNLELKGMHGYYFPESYRYYVYEMIYRELTGKKPKRSLLEITDSKTLFYASKLEYHSKTYLKRLKKIIKILKIDFKKESNRLQRVLFDTKSKKDFRIDDKVYALR